MRCCNGADRGSAFAPPARGLTSCRCHTARILSKPLTRGMFTMGNLGYKRPLPSRKDEGRSLRRAIVRGGSLGADARVLYRTCVRLERRAVKVACVVLRGLGGCEPTWLPGETYQVTLHVYVLMPNHFHLVVETPRANLSEFMRHFNVTYTGYFNRRHGRVGHLYQGRFQAFVVEAETYMTELSRYVHLNPIRVARFRQAPVGEKLRYLRGYRWSSLPGYLHTTKRSAVVEYRLVLAGFGGDHERGRHAYARFIEEGMKEGVGSPWE
jgi:Transposase IS200 like